MNIRLRTVIYLNTVEIENVPIFSCEACQRSELFPPVKPELAGMIRALGAKPEIKRLFFDEISEIAYLMHKAADKEHRNLALETILEERINELLDLLLLAQSLGDREWVGDVRRRLQQITGNAIHTYRFS